MKGYVEVAQLLIEAGANTNNRGPGGTTPLWAAAHAGHKNIVMLLLRAKANPLLTADGEHGFAPLPLDAVAGNGQLGAVLNLLQHAGIEGCGGASGGIDALCHAAQFGEVGVMAVLTDVGVVDTGEALCKAAENSHEGSVNFLLQEQQRKRWTTSCIRGYVHAADPHGRTPLCCSIDACSPRVARCLLDAGADVTTGVHASHKAGAVACNQTPWHTPYASLIS